MCFSGTIIFLEILCTQNFNKDDFARKACVWSRFVVSWKTYQHKKLQKTCRQIFDVRQSILNTATCHHHCCRPHPRHHRHNICLIKCSSKHPCVGTKDNLIQVQHAQGKTWLTWRGSRILRNDKIVMFINCFCMVSFEGTLKGFSTKVLQSEQQQFKDGGWVELM